MQPVGRSWQGQPHASITKSGDTVDPNTMGTTGEVLHPSPLEATLALPMDIPEGLFLPLSLHKRRLYTAFLPRRPLSVISGLGLCHMHRVKHPFVSLLTHCELYTEIQESHPVPED